MKTITVTGDPHSMTAIMVPKTDSYEYKDHETVKLESTDHDHSVEKTIFRIVDAGDEGLELQFE